MEIDLIHLQWVVIVYLYAAGGMYFLHTSAKDQGCVLQAIIYLIWPLIALYSIVWATKDVLKGE